MEYPAVQFDQKFNAQGAAVEMPVLVQRRFPK
jgi:hypothetical protein